MRALSDPATDIGDGLETGGWLHLDVAMGASGDMLCAALLDLGVHERVLREALHDAGLFELGVRRETSTRGGLKGVRLDFTYDDDSLEDAPRRTRAKRHQRHKTRAPKRAVRRERSAAEVEQFADDAPETPVDEPKQTPPTEVERWLAGDRVRASELVAFLETAKLAPVVRALARKAARRMFETLFALTGRDDVELAGPVGVDVLCDLIAFSALIDALSPARVTTSRVATSIAPVEEANFGLTPGPSPWTLAILGEISTVNRDLSFPPTTPTGAALLWTLAHQVSDDVPVQRAAGFGLGTRVVPGVANACRAIWGPLPVVDTREGTARTELVTVTRGRAQNLDRPGLEQALFARGARLLSAIPTTEGSVVEVQSSRQDAGLRELLFSFGLESLVEVAASAVAPGSFLEVLSVEKTDIRVRVLTGARGQILSAEPDAEDLARAARRSGRTTARLREEVVQSIRARKEGP